jgi:putative transposase
MCQVLEVSRSGYYSWHNRRKSKRAEANEKLTKRIKELHTESRKVYGSPRMTDALRKEGICCGKNRVACIMRLEGIVGVGKKKFKVTTDSKHNKPVHANIVQQRFEAERPNRLWTSDITYVWTKEGWMYLSVILDVYSRMVVGWSLQLRLHKRLVLDALRDAVHIRRPAPGLIFHSDRGSQYASDDVQRILKRYEIRGSMSGRGNCYDNAISESFIGSFKTELVYQEIFPTRRVARSMVFDYIEVFYNRQRIHSSIGNMSPFEYEQQMLPVVRNQITLS